VMTPERTKMFCTHCGTEVSLDFNFCPRCGKVIAVQSSAPNVQQAVTANRNQEPQTLNFKLVTCPTCGFQNAADARSCESCGTFLKSAVSNQRSSVSDVPEIKDKVVEKRKAPKLQKTSSKSNPIVDKYEKKFHLRSYQVVSIVAALLLGGILVYGLMSSKPVVQQGDTGNGTQQQSSTSQPSADVLHGIDRLRQVVDKNPDDLVSTLRLSNMLQDNEMYDQAVVYYKRYLEKIPDNVDARVDYGVTLYEAGHTQEAIDELNHAIKMDPRHQKAFFNLGIVYLNAGEIDKSNDAFKKCVEIDSQSDIGKQAEQILTQHANIKN